MDLSFFATTDTNVDQNYDKNSCSNTNENAKQGQFADSWEVFFFDSFFKIGSGGIILGFVVGAFLFLAILDLWIGISCIIPFVSKICEILYEFHFQIEKHEKICTYTIEVLVFSVVVVEVSGKMLVETFLCKQAFWIFW